MEDIDPEQTWLPVFNIFDLGISALISLVLNHR
jgi:hypothetical protein